jgi:hypothetical protein
MCIRHDGPLGLNAAQLRIVQWVTRRPDLQAPWDEFVEELGDRLSPVLRDEYLLALREHALLDFDATPKRGYLATYPAIRAALPVARRADLQAYFSELRADTLGQVVSIQELAERPTRKDERINC